MSTCKTAAVINLRGSAALQHSSIPVSVRNLLKYWLYFPWKKKKKTSVKYASNLLLFTDIQYTLHSSLVILTSGFPPHFFLSLSVYNGGINGTSTFPQRYAKCHGEINNDIHVCVNTAITQLESTKNQKKVSAKNSLSPLSFRAFKYSPSAVKGFLRFDMPVDFWAVSERPLKASMLADNLKIHSLPSARSNGKYQGHEFQSLPKRVLL